MKIFKVFYQDHTIQRLIREETLSKYVEAENVEQVRKHFTNDDITIEHVEALSPDHLNYEKEHNPDFEVIVLQ